MAIDPNIKQKADDIRTKVYGSEVRESLASGLEAMSSDVVETVGRQGNVESQFQDVIENTTDKDVISAPEIIAARNGEANLKARLDKNHNEVTAQLAQIAYQVAPIDGEDYGVTVNRVYQSIPDYSTLKLVGSDIEYQTPIILNRRIHVDMTNVNLVYTGDSLEPLRIGSLEFAIGDIDFTNINITKKVMDWTTKNIGIRIVNMMSCTFYGLNVRNFNRGIVVEGYGDGNSYNKYYLQSLWNNKESLVITSRKDSSGAIGWSNENIFQGGRFAWTSDTNATSENIHVHVEFIDYSNNNNHFYGLSLESASSGGINALAIKNDRGRNNSFNEFRYEGVENIHITEGSYYTDIDKGYSLNYGKINDEGFSTSINASNKIIHKRSNPFEFTQTTTINEDVVRFNNASNQIVGRIAGDGGIYSRYKNSERLVQPVHSGQYTSGRPSNVPIGYLYFDIGLGLPLWWKGENWVKADGTPVS